jgi:hypothetical protein
MSRFHSPYYPPRASWYSPLFRLVEAAKRMMWLDRIHLPAGMATRAFLAGLLIPGYAFVVRGERLIGRVVMLSYGLLAAVFIIWLGYPIANIGFGLMLSLHVSSVIFLLNPWLADARIPFRLLTGLALLVFVGGGLYAPIRRQVETNWLMPLRINQNVVIVQTFSSSASVKRGDWVAYKLEDERGTGLYSRAGLGLRPVLAVAGAQVRFTDQSYVVNGVSLPRLPHMPTTGELTVPEKNWFIWPDFAISNRGNIAEANISAAMLRLAMVAEVQFVGKPLKRWFWRRQHLS